MKNNALNRTTMLLWEDCIEMLGPGDVPQEQFFLRPMADLRPIRRPSASEAPTSRSAGTHYLQKFVPKTKTPVAGLL